MTLNQNTQNVLEGQLIQNYFHKINQIATSDQFLKLLVIKLLTLLFAQVLFDLDCIVFQTNSQINLNNILIIYSQNKIMQSRKGWTEIEDDKLVKIIKKYGTKNWSLISQKLSIGTTFQKTGKQCRERWHNHLNPGINTKNWSQEEDQILFQAHRKQGSRWKQISKLFSGRTDNSIKNHFYSTIRKSLRTISKLKGEKNTTITMKSIKPSVLSKIVQNTQLTNLIVKLARSKSKQTTNLNIDRSVIDQISLELKRISIQYCQKNKQSLQLRKKGAQSYKSVSLKQQCSEGWNAQIQQFPILKDTAKQYRAEDQLLKHYFEEFQSPHNQRSSFILETNNESKQRVESHIKDLFVPSHNSESQSNSDFKLEFQFKFSQFQRQMNEDSCILEECESNFFTSPTSGKKHFFPDLRLLGKVSKNSIPSPACSSKYDDKMGNSTISKGHHVKQEPIEIEFDPREYLNQKKCQKQQA